MSLQGYIYTCARNTLLLLESEKRNSERSLFFELCVLSVWKKLRMTAFESLSLAPINLASFVAGKRADNPFILPTDH